MRTVTLSAPRFAVAPGKLGYFRYTRLDGGKYVLTGDGGDFHLLTEPDFLLFLRGEMDAEHPEHAALTSKGFLRDNLDTEALAERVRNKKHFLTSGPHLHEIVTTLRCNQDCRYCHASRVDMSKVETDMTLETAKKIVDVAMQTTAPMVNFEYQGGEPTLNFDVIKFVVEYSAEKNRTEKKELVHSVVTNMTAMDEEKAEWLIANDVLVCASLDGPEELHSWNRRWAGEKEDKTFPLVLQWINYFNQRYIEMGRDPELWHVDALLTTTTRTLDLWKEVVDLYVELGIRNLHLRPLNPFGFAHRTWHKIGYTPEEFNVFYTKAFDYIIELNKKGVQIIEGTAATFLKKMLTPYDPNFVDIRSPEGSGTGQIAYSWDGTIYPSDEGRMIGHMGDDTFALGHVDHTTYDEMVRHPTVRALAVASLCDSLPMCVDCFNAPYCGVRPLHNYMTTGDLFGQRPNTARCSQHMHTVRTILNYLADDESGQIEGIFRRWVIDRPRIDEAE